MCSNESGTDTSSSPDLIHQSEKNRINILVSIPCDPQLPHSVSQGTSPFSMYINILVYNSGRQILFQNGGSWSHFSRILYYIHRNLHREGKYLAGHLATSHISSFCGHSAPKSFMFLGHDWWLLKSNPASQQNKSLSQVQHTCWWSHGRNYTILFSTTIHLPMALECMLVGT